MKTFLLTALIVTGCAHSSGVIPMGPDTYFISRVAGGMNAGEATLKVEAFKEAGAYCTDQGKQLHIESASESQHGMAAPKAEVQFRCLSAGDPALKDNTLRPVPNSVIEVHHD